MEAAVTDSEDKKPQTIPLDESTVEEIRGAYSKWNVIQSQRIVLE